VKAKQWVEITLSAPDSYQDLLVGPLTALGFGGFLQEKNSLKAFIEKPLWNEGVRPRLQYYLRNFQKEFPRFDRRFATRTINHDNWNRKWEQSIQVIEATPRIVIKPSWKKLSLNQKKKLVLHIDPKMSFGTGHHESTRLCLLLLEEYMSPHMSVLDFGSGTGILAIAAIKLGAMRAVAVDNDEWTIPNIRENIERNRVRKNIKVVLGNDRSIPNSSFDLIVANLDLSTIQRSIRVLFRRLKRGGILILSGILTSDLLPLHESLVHIHLAPLTIIEENEWAALALSKI
jgi:ribosomal protein L11 methyltransferase